MQYKTSRIMESEDEAIKGVEEDGKEKHRLCLCDRPDLVPFFSVFFCRFLLASLLLFQGNYVGQGSVQLSTSLPRVYTLSIPRPESTPRSLRDEEIGCRSLFFFSLSFPLLL